MGQALPEFALALPVFALVMLVALDFGRALTAWVGLQHSARIAANFVSVNPTAWDGSHPHGWHDTQSQMETLVYNDAATSNCDRGHGAPNSWLTIDVSSPTDTSYGAGDPATVSVTCDFNLITPLIGVFLPDPLVITAGASFPIRTSVVDNISGRLVVRFYAVKITATVACPNPCYEFHDLTQPAATSWSWAFGDGTTSTAQQPTHSYASPGLYSVTLTVTTSVGSGSWSQILNVSATDFPGAAFSLSPSSGTAPLNVQFVDGSTGSPSSWSWLFGDGGVSSVQNPLHTYAAAGTFTIRLTVNGGSYAEHTVNVSTATPPPVANFTFSPSSGTAPLLVTFTDTSTGSPTSWAWDFTNDGTTDSVVQNPTHTYSSAGTYTIRLTATNPYGSSSTTKTLTVTSDVCLVPNFVNDSYTHNNQASFQAAETAKWQAVQTGGVHFVSTPTFNPILTSKGGRITSQSLPANSIQSCANASIQLNGNW
jgi:PKD repeat protein